MMRAVLIGADLEENLGLGMVAAAALADGHQVQVVPFDGDETEALARRIAAGAPDVVGLGMQFQPRAREHLGLARALREAGYSGHITAGGQLATLAWERVLEQGGIDSVVLHDGEETFPALLRALEQATPLQQVAGLALPGVGGARRTAPRGLVHDLDRLPLAHRYRPHAIHMGVPFIPVLGGRGCWGRCAFCSIRSFYRGGRAAGGGSALRLRSPQNLAAEMALLWLQAGGRAVFCFHDDNLLLPRPEGSLARLQAIRAELDRHGVGRVALVGKCRPDVLTPELARALRELGVVRLFVGVENASQRGADHLGRGVDVAQARRAVEACQEAGIFCCYNLLVFEPEATLADIEQNVAFIRAHPYFPVNFCRAEAYVGTALHDRLGAAGKLWGDAMGGDYRLEDDRAETLFRICAAAFRERNFARRGVHNRYMGLGYSAKLLEVFYPAGERRDALIDEAERLTRAIALETADLLEEAITIARGLAPEQHDRIEREAVLLALRVAAADRDRHAHLDRLFGEMEAFVTEQLAPPERRRARRARLLHAAQSLARALAVAGLLGGGGMTLEACGDGRAIGDAGADIWPTDDAPNPYDDIWPTDDAPNPYDDIWPTDDAPSSDWTVDGMVVDPAPDMVVDPPPPPDMQGPQDAGAPQARRGGEQPLDSWHDSGPRRVRRSPDLPLYDPPLPVLEAERRGESVVVRLCCGGGRPVNTRWEGDGRIEGEGMEVRWVPECDDDQIRVAVRSTGGVAVVTLRARAV
jgi:anaerobic magnesium-protoporphyrin IX monomethyl ester cyclase